MKILTKLPVYTDGKRIYSNFGDDEIGPANKPSGPLPGLGGAGYKPTGSATKTATSKTSLADKFKNAQSFLKTSGLGDAAKQALANRQAKNNPNLPDVSTSSAPEAKKGMSIGTKVGIALGIAAVVGIVIYAVKKKK